MKYPTDSKGRYLRIPTPLKREAWQSRSPENSINLIKSHKIFIAWYQKKLGLSDYGLLWLTFFKGVILTLIIERWIFID